MSKEKKRFDFESLYEKYPRKMGKKRGMTRLKIVVTSQADYDGFVLALDNYIAQIVREGTEPKYVKHWITFVNNYTDHLTKDLPVMSVTQNQIARIMSGNL